MSARKKSAAIGLAVAAAVTAVAVVLPKQTLPLGCELQEAITSKSVLAVAICKAKVVDDVKLVFWPPMDGAVIRFQPCGDAGVCERWRAP